VNYTNLTTIPKKREDFERLIGFDYIKSLLDPKTPYGQKYFQHLVPLSFENILTHHSDVEELIKTFQNEKFLEDILNNLECVLDVSHTFERIKNKEILDEIELFELKNYVLVVDSIREKIKNHLPKKFVPPELTDVIDLLDPEGLRMPTFYIYDAYSKELAEIRKKKRELLKSENTCEDEILALTEKESQIEKMILEEISQRLSNYHHIISESIEKIKYFDVILTKTRLAKELGLACPQITREKNRSIKIKGMFNPKLKSELEKLGKTYQPVDIEITPGVTVMVGANMSGKSVVLRTVALIQYMAQLGFFVPAWSCELTYVDNISIIAEDNQKPLSGLSSFGAEILAINETLKESDGKVSLILIDEPARTTNPYEGTIIVNALVKIFEKNKSYTIIVTHFDDIQARRRLRIKGLREELLKDKSIYKPEEIINNLQDYIDYQIIEVDDSIVPKDAIKIMKLLNIDEKIMKLVKEKEYEKEA